MHPNSRFVVEVSWFISPIPYLSMHILDVTHRNTEHLGHSIHSSNWLSQSKNHGTHISSESLPPNVLQLDMLQHVAAQFAATRFFFRTLLVTATRKRVGHGSRLPGLRVGVEGKLGKRCLFPGFGS